MNIKNGEGKTRYIGTFWRTSPFLENSKTYMGMKMYTKAKVAIHLPIYWQLEQI